MPYGIAIAMLLTTWFFPPAGIVLQGAWLVWILVDKERQSVWIWLSGPTLFLVHFLSDVRVIGPSGLLLILDFPFTIVSIFIAINAHPKIPWWLTLLLTSPLTSIALVLILQHFGFENPRIPWQQF